MAGVVQALRDALARAYADVDTLPARISSWLNVNQAREAAMNALDADSRQIDDLAGRKADMVLTGAMSPERWEDTAKLLHQDIQYQVKTSNEWPLSKIIWEAGAATVEDVKSVAAVGLPILALGALGLGFLYVSAFLPKRRA